MKSKRLFLVHLTHFGLAISKISLLHLLFRPRWQAIQLILAVSFVHLLQYLHQHLEHRYLQRIIQGIECLAGVLPAISASFCP